MKGTRLLLATGSIFLFVFGLQLLGDSTTAVAEILRGVVKKLVTGDISSLGAGWILAYLVLNGATSAAIGIAFLQSGIIDTLNTFMFISGSRLGATFIVVFIGILEYLQGKNDDIRDSCSIGLLQFLTTYAIYIPAIVLGYISLSTFELSFLRVSAPAAFNYGLELIFGPFTSILSNVLPPTLLFLVSILTLVVSLRLFDRSFKGISEESFKSKYVRFRLTDKWAAFAAGSAITLVTTSVALSVGIIVPLYNRGYFMRREIIPYLMGANLTTMISSIMAAAVIESAGAMKATLVLTIAVLSVTAVALILYDRFYQMIQKTFNTVMLNNTYLYIFTASLVLTPLLLILLF
ncbi:sodium:phosphate symporter [Nanohaloarchaea archaeon]|nr:sodium:phosphate symporter [Candidatus Nanohaloarchaea archaeon]